MGFGVCKGVLIEVPKWGWMDCVFTRLVGLLEIACLLGLVDYFGF